LDLLNQLESLNGKKYNSAQEFINAIESEISKELTEEYRFLLLKYGRYKKKKS
jgi:hypothetical protein